MHAKNKYQPRDVPSVCNMCGTVQSFITNCKLRQGCETLTTVHEILKPMDVLTCIKGRRGQHCTWKIGSGEKDSWHRFLFSRSSTWIKLLQGRIDPLQDLCQWWEHRVPLQDVRPLSHTAPDSIVHCLCPGVDPPIYKSKVWARSWGHLGSSVVQTLHRHGQGTVPDSCSLTVNPPRQVGLLQQR